MVRAREKKHPHPVALAVNKSPAVFIFLHAPDPNDLERENTRSLIRLRKARVNILVHDFVYLPKYIVQLIVLCKKPGFQSTVELRFNDALYNEFLSKKKRFSLLR